jgi:hypothetical protein
LTIAYSKTPIDKVGVANPRVFDARVVGMCRGLILCLAAQGLFVPRHNKHKTKVWSMYLQTTLNMYSGVQRSLQERKGVWWMPWF